MNIFRVLWGQNETGIAETAVVGSIPNEVDVGVRFCLSLMDILEEALLVSHDVVKYESSSMQW